MTWEIVAGIIALVGVFGTVATWSSKLSRTLASLEVTLAALDKTLQDLKDNNRESHEEFHKRLSDHEGRIIHLEDCIGKNKPPR